MPSYYYDDNNGTTADDDDDDDGFAMDNANNTLYQSLKNQHPCWLFVGNSILKILYVTPGIVMNFGVVFVTLRSNSLRNTSNFLLALNSLVELFHQPAHFLSVFLAFSGLNFLDYLLAVRICTLSIFGLAAIAPSLFFTGIDRLLAVTFLAFYERINVPVYLSSIMAICSAFSGYTVYLMYRSAHTNDQLQVPGNIGDLLKGDASQFYYQYTMILNTLTIVVYIAVGTIIRIRSEDQTHKRIFRSLFSIISICIGGYYVMRIYTNFVVPNVKWDQVTIWIVRQICSIPLNISSGSNGPILYMTSIEYRKAFQMELGLIVSFLRRNGLWWKEDNNKVKAMTITNQTNQVRSILSTMNYRE